MFSLSILGIGLKRVWEMPSSLLQSRLKFSALKPSTSRRVRVDVVLQCAVIVSVLLPTVLEQTLSSLRWMWAMDDGKPRYDYRSNHTIVVIFYVMKEPFRYYLCQRFPMRCRHDASCITTPVETAAETWVEMDAPTRPKHCPNFLALT